MDWQTLLELFEQGDPAAGAALVSALAPGLETYAEIVAPHLGQADREQAVDAALLKVIDALDRYDPDKASLPTWARGFVRNELRERERSNKEDATDPADIHDMLANTPVDAPEPERLADQKDAALTALVLQQGLDAALLIELHVVEGLTFPAIAKRLGDGTGAATLRKRYQRAKERIYEAAREDPHLQQMTEETS